MDGIAFWPDVPYGPYCGVRCFSGWRTCPSPKCSRPSFSRLCDLALIVKTSPLLTVKILRLFGWMEFLRSTRAGGAAIRHAQPRDRAGHAADMLRLPARAYRKFDQRDGAEWAHGRLDVRRHLPAD